MDDDDAKLVNVHAKCDRDLTRMGLALKNIAQGVPRKDEWRSAADFMEDVANILDRANVPRPDHYPEQWS